MELDQFRNVDLVIDKANDNFIAKQFVSEGDFSGRTMTVQLTNAGVIGKIPGIQMALRWHNKASGLTDLSAFYLINAENTVFRITYPEHMLTPGVVEANIMITHDGKTVMTKAFEIRVAKLAGEMKGIIDRQEFSYILSVLTDANKFRTDIDTLENKKADKIDLAQTNENIENLDSTKADKTALANTNQQVSGLMSTKVDKGGASQVTWSMIAQDAREQISGDKVAVVGQDSVTTENYVDGSVNNEKLNVDAQGLQINRKATYPLDNVVLIDGTVNQNFGLMKELFLDIKISGGDKEYIYIFQKATRDLTAKTASFNLVRAPKLANSACAIADFEQVVTASYTDVDFSSDFAIFELRGKNGEILSVTIDAANNSAFKGGNYVDTKSKLYFGFGKIAESCFLQTGYDEFSKAIFEGPEMIYKNQEYPLERVDVDGNTLTYKSPFSDHYRILDVSVTNPQPNLVYVIDSTYLNPASCGVIFGAFTKADDGLLHADNYNVLTSTAESLVAVDENAEYVKVKTHHGATIFEATLQLDKTAVLNKPFKYAEKKNNYFYEMIKIREECYRYSTNGEPAESLYQKLNALGDSLTEVNLHADTHWHDILKQKNIVGSVNNYGISGSTIGDTGHNPMSVRYASMDATADLILVFGGVNDFGLVADPVPLGTMDDRVNTTFYGGLHVLLAGLLAKFPGKKIGYITFHHVGVTKLPPTNKLGFKAVQYIKAIKDVCAYYSVPVCNLYENGGINLEIAEHNALFSTDNLHLNDTGQTWIGNVIAKFVEVI